MGRFETTAEFYKFREPYPPPFFQTLSETLQLGKHTRMLDVACGPGNLAIGFAPYVGTCLAIDIEPEMLRVATEAASQTNITFQQTPIEDLTAPQSSFDFVTIGRAIHWLPQEASLAVFERVIAGNGLIAVCAAAATDAPCNAWTANFRDLRRKWSNDYDESRYRPDLDAWFAPSPFRRTHELTATQTYTFTIEHLINRALSFSVTSPAVLGDRRTEFESELRTALDPFANNGALQEEIEAKAIIFEAKTATSHPLLGNVSVR
jgi:SAM-dependent methyltransferase